MATQEVGFGGSGGVDGHCDDDQAHVKLAQYYPDSIVQGIGFSFKHTPRPKELVLMNISVAYNPSKLNNSNESM